MPGRSSARPVVIGDDTFCADLFVMPLAGYDLVLGTQCLAALGPVLWDFGAQTMTFQRHGRTVCWAGVPSTGELSLGTVTASDSLLVELLDSFGDVFAEPSGLPPNRAHDHRITLKTGA